MPHHPPPGVYRYATGSGVSSEDAAAAVFPADAAVVLLGTEPWGSTVVYTFLIDYPEAVAA